MKKNERIHHRCRCLDRNFTLEEWIEWLENPDSHSAVLNVGTFQFNIWDVCLTPNQPVRIEKNNCKLEIETAQSLNGRWEYGIDLELHNEGSSHGASFVDDTSLGYPTEREAIYDSLLFSEARTVKKIGEVENRGDTQDDYDDEESGRQPKASAILSSLRAFLKEIQRYKHHYGPNQLSLFEL